MSRIQVPSLSGIAALVLITPLFMIASSTPVSARSDWADLDCNDLWYERNGLYAHYGHCFKTDRGIKAFHNHPNTYPNVCKPPHGKLPPAAAADVAAIKREEARKKCK